MSFRAILQLILIAAMTMGPVAPVPSEYARTNTSQWPRRDDASLSVMTYNIKSLPWPIARGRAEAIDAIGKQLSLMRERGIQPHIVLLQEAFTDHAKAIAHAAGYRFVATGPASPSESAAPPLGFSYASAARWDRGEIGAGALDSGLMILSDYPIVRSRKIAFPAGACAGFDCLASKGILIAWIAVPGVSEPMAIVDTHLNARRATHVSESRADAANVWQLSRLHEIVMREVGSNAPAIFGGDTNVGQAHARKSAFARYPVLGPNAKNGLKIALADDAVPPRFEAEARSVLQRNKDMILSRNGERVSLRPVRAWIPFPLETTSPLSDHTGILIAYSLRS